MSAYERIIDYLESLKIAFIRRFAPSMIAGIGCHMVNIENQQRAFYFEQGQIANLRSHVFFVAPTGYFKSLLIRCFLHGTYSVVDGTSIPTGFESVITEAGFVGTIKQIEGKTTVIEGAAAAYKEGIFGVEEFSALSNAMKMEHSLNLDNAMLTALDNGFVIKRLALGRLNYVTHCTIFCGSQPARFDLTSGMGRRFNYMWFIPSEDDRMKIRIARRESRNIVPNRAMKESLSKEIMRIKMGVTNITAIKFDEKLYELLDKFDVPHYEEPIYERMALGYNVMHYGTNGGELEVKVDDECKRILEQSYGWREQVKRGADISQIIQVIEGLSCADVHTVRKRIMEFGYSYEQTIKMLNKLEAMKAIGYRVEEIDGAVKRILIVKDRTL